MSYGGFTCCTHWYQDPIQLKDISCTINEKLSRERGRNSFFREDDGFRKGPEQSGNISLGSF